MGVYFNYTGVGGSYYGTGLPTSSIITNTEKVICMTPVPDNRQPVQGGVLITANVTFGISTCTFATILCRQSTLGTSTAVTGSLLLNGGNVGTGTYAASIGTTAATYPVASFGQNIFTWVDYTGTYGQGLPVYQITGSTAAGTATILSAQVTVTPLAV